MKKQITFLGLGQIGASIGLGLSNYGDKFHRVGYDPSSGLAARAKKNSVIDQSEYFLVKSIVDADIVVLSLPLNEVEQTLEAMGEDLKENVILLDTSPVRESSTAWVNKYLPGNCEYIGFTPMISPKYIEKLENGFNAARGDLFEGGLFAITVSNGASAEAMEMAAMFAELLKAEVYFADLTEMDSIMASVHILPQLISSALVNSSMSRESWKEGRKFAGRPFALGSSLNEYQDSPAAISKAAVANKENTVRVMDEFIGELQRLRDEIEKGSEEYVEKFVEQARWGRMGWLGERKTGKWSGEESTIEGLESSKMSFTDYLFGKRKKK